MKQPARQPASRVATTHLSGSPPMEASLDTALAAIFLSARAALVAGLRRNSSGAPGSSPCARFTLPRFNQLPGTLQASALCRLMAGATGPQVADSVLTAASVERGGACRRNQVKPKVARLRHAPHSAGMVPPRCQDQRLPSSLLRTNTAGKLDHLVLALLSMRR